MRTYSDLELKWKHCDLLFFDLPDELYIAKLAVPKSEQGKGLGTRIMKDVCRFADSQGKVLTLKPSVCYGSNLRRLRRFYKRFGFTTKRCDTEMIRKPKP
jgi:GNAT superfamily N-acetyltransferase